MAKLEGHGEGHIYPGAETVSSPSPRSAYLPILLFTVGLLIIAGAVLTLVPLKECRPCTWGTIKLPDPTMRMRGCHCSGSGKVPIWDLRNREPLYLSSGRFE